MFIRLRRTRHPRRTLRCSPRIPGHMHSEGLINQEGFSPLPSEGYILSTASPPILMADFSLLQGFSLMSSPFPCSMFSLASFLGGYSICMHHRSMFCVLAPKPQAPKPHTHSPTRSGTRHRGCGGERASAWASSGRGQLQQACGFTAV
jgi:hypothetical protein